MGEDRRRKRAKKVLDREEKAGPFEGKARAEEED